MFASMQPHGPPCICPKETNSTYTVSFCVLEVEISDSGRFRITFLKLSKNIVVEVITVSLGTLIISILFLAQTLRDVIQSVAATHSVLNVKLDVSSVTNIAVSKQG